MIQYYKKENLEPLIKSRYNTIENKLHKNCITYNKREIVKVED